MYMSDFPENQIDFVQEQANFIAILTFGPSLPSEPGSPIAPAAPLKMTINLLDLQ